jgi:pimeloyl-ACP methyl ester carboxylesterase
MSPDSALERIIPVNGMEMYCRTRGQGEPLVLLHGFYGCHSDWDLIFPEPPDSYREIAPDLRGHGRSTNPAGTFTFRQCALDVLALLDWLGVDRFKAIGASGGGEALLHMATAQPGRVESMVLISAAPYFPVQARELMRQAGPEGRSEEEWAAMRRRHTRGDDQIRQLWGAVRAFADSYEDVNFTPALLSSIVAPTLIVHGDRDPLYPVDLAVQMFAAIPRSYLWIVPNGGHAPVWGEMNRAFVAAATAFLSGGWARDGSS